MARRWVEVFAALAALSAGVGTPPAVADGLPVLGVDVGGTGVETSDGVYRNVSPFPPGAPRSWPALRRTGRAIGRRTLPGSFTIPAVAYDGSADGLSADGNTVVLIAFRSGFPQTRTTLDVVDTGRLLVRATVRLAGDFSFDAISPHGATLYLVQYASANPTDYRVRAYDLPSGRPATAPIVDPTGPSGRPFVHALDATRHTARCIDLDDLRGDIPTTHHRRCDLRRGDVHCP